MSRPTTHRGKQGGTVGDARVRARASGTTTTARGGAYAAPGWVLGYLAGWQDIPVADVPWQHLTQVGIFSAIPSTALDGTLDDTFSQANSAAGLAWAESVADAAKSAGVTPLLTIGGDGYHDRTVAPMATAGLRATFITNVLTIVDAIGAEGVDVDLEPINEADIPHLVAFCQDLRTARPGLLITLVAGGVNANTNSQVSASTGDLDVYDQIDVITYDAQGDPAWGGWQSWHINPLAGHAGSYPMDAIYSISKYVEAGIPLSKLAIGLAGYGAGYSGVTGPRQSGGTLIGADAVFPIATIVDTYMPAMTAAWDAAAYSPYLTSATPVGASNVQYISYEDEESAAQRGTYARLNRLGGLMLWTVDSAHVDSAAAGQRDKILEGAARGIRNNAGLYATPTAPTFADTGAGAGTYTIPTTDGVQYLVAGSVVAAGTYAGSTSTTVTAEPTLGREFRAGVTASWTHEYSTASEAAYVSGSHAKGWLSAATPAALTDVEAGDVLVAFACRINSAAALTVPDGWTVVGESTSSSPAHRYTVLTAASTANTAPTFTYAASATTVVTVTAWRGVAAPSSAVFSPHNANAATTTIPDRTSPAAGALVVSNAYATNGASGSFAGATNVYSSPGSPSTYVGSEVTTGSGSVGTRLFTNSQSTSIMACGVVLGAS